ncbi:MAG: isoprenylcysteine carboxylmethyltransferase family protein [Planctomycetes bacterium]|nr:isoprenylcysteine carboxylmethyltransferase family protein [Planctomycetota bacterium]
MLRRLPFFLYGVLVYAAFFAIFCYLFGFATNLLVPKSIDAPNADGRFPVWLGPALLLLFGVQHAIMARPRFKAWIAPLVPHAIERSTFVLVATAILAATMYVWQPLPTPIWELESPFLRNAFLALSAAGFALVLGSSFLIDHFDLFGLRQVTLHLLGKPYTQRPFVERAIYRHVRHPLMLGFLVWMWSTPTLTLGHLLFAGLLSAYMAVGLRLEERDLVAQHGEAYRAYQRRTPMLLPRLFRAGTERAETAAVRPSSR